MRDRKLLIPIFFTLASCGPKPERLSFNSPKLAADGSDEDVSQSNDNPIQKDKSVSKSSSGTKTKDSTLPDTNKMGEAAGSNLLQVTVPLPYSLVEARQGSLTSGASATGSELITYRVAIAASFKYVNSSGGADKTIAEIKRGLAHINSIFQRDAAIRFELVPDSVERSLMFTSNIDPLDYSLKPSWKNFENLNGAFDRIVGAQNYDFGHIYYPDPIDGAGWGGNSPCVAGGKANGMSFSYEAMVHEMGHQFSAPHSCYVEGGDGVHGSVMCRGDGDTDYFHLNSIESIFQYSRQGEGSKCGVRTKVANTPPKPFLALASDLTIPHSTPFRLVGGAIDAEDQTKLTYTWHQMDENSEGPGSYENPLALFRSFFPSTTGYVRYFPNLDDLAKGVSSPAEKLPTNERDLNFALVVRDNSPLAGGVDSVRVKVHVSGMAGPFRIIEPQSSLSWKIGSRQIISWLVAGTDKAPVNCQQVNILISEDGGKTFKLIAQNIPNNGKYEIEVPNLPSNNARIMIQSADNIFFAVQPKVVIKISP